MYTTPVSSQLHTKSSSKCTLISGDGLSDTFGLVNLEAMEHSKPVVATSFGGSQEVVIHGETGFIANPFDVEAFSGFIGRLLDESDLRVEMGRRGRERLLERFTIDRLAEDFMGIYSRAVEVRGDGGESADSKSPETA